MKTAIITDIHIGFSGNKMRKFQKAISKMVEEKYEAVIISGDISTSRPSQIKNAFEAIRAASLTLKVFVVWGNHDAWDDTREFDNMMQLDQYREKLCKEFDIHYLGEDHFSNETHQIFGYDGWYNTAFPGSNDNNFIPGDIISSFEYLQRQQKYQMEYILEYMDTSKHVVVVTHHNPIANEAKWEAMSGNKSNFLELARRGINTFIYGHTHIKQDEKVTYEGNEIRMINAGADYYTVPTLHNDYIKTLYLGGKDG